VCRGVIERDPAVAFSVSHTTRAPRDGEVAGLDYHFVSADEFRRLVAKGAFLEHAEYSGNLYGTSWMAIESPLERGRDVLLEIETEGARQVRERQPDAHLIFLLPPSLALLEDAERAIDDVLAFVTAARRGELETIAERFSLARLRATLDPALVAWLD